MQAMSQKECNSKGTRKPPLSGFLSFAILAICSFTRSVQTTRLKGLGLGLRGRTDSHKTDIANIAIFFTEPAYDLGAG